MPNWIDLELRARSVRLVVEHRAQYPTETAAVVAVAVAKQLGASRSRCDVGRRRPGWTPATVQVSPATTTPRSRSSRRRTSGCGRTLKSSVRRRFSSRGDSTPAAADRRVHRPDEKLRPFGRVGLSGPGSVQAPPLPPTRPTRLNPVSSNQRRPRPREASCLASARVSDVLRLGGLRSAAGRPVEVLPGEHKTTVRPAPPCHWEVGAARPSRSRDRSC